MSKDPNLFLRHILEECDFLETTCKNISKEVLLNDEVLKRAETRSLEIISEAAKKIPIDFREKYNSVLWKNMTGMRDRLIHDYFGINYSIVWDVIQNKIPELQKEIRDIIQ